MCALLLALILDLTAAGAPNTAPDVPLQATSLGVWYGKPPLAFNRFDVTVRNPSAQARWMILPSTFPNQGRIEPAPGVSDVIELQIFRLSSKVLFVKAVGGEFQAVKLPGHGTIKLRELAIDSWWEEAAGLGRAGADRRALGEARRAAARRTDARAAGERERRRDQGAVGSERRSRRHHVAPARRARGARDLRHRVARAHHRAFIEARIQRQ